jgi:phosphatidyl-myo-inositol alpha-mannosyltransferase
MVSAYLPSGSKIGVGHQAHALANELVSRGHDVSMFSRSGPSDGALYETQTVPVYGSGRTFKFAYALRHIDWRGFDVLHAHTDDYWLWDAPARVHVRTLHGSCFDEAIHISGVRERARMALLGFSELLATAVADETVAVSRNTLRWTPWVKRVIPNGVDLQRFRQGERAEVPTILFVGTYERRKRGKLLMEIFQRQIRPQLPDAQLWMVAEDAPSRDGVTVFGRVSDQDLADLYARAWVFCLPSTYEGFGIPYVEAMASGCPVVASPNPGAVEITSAGRYGMLAPDNELGPTILRLLNTSSERERLARKGLERARDFDLVRVAADYEALYAEAITKRHR